jgi:hypothetical protein
MYLGRIDIMHSTCTCKQMYTIHANACKCRYKKDIFRDKACNLAAKKKSSYSDGPLFVHTCTLSSCVHHLLKLSLQHQRSCGNIFDTEEHRHSKRLRIRDFTSMHTINQTTNCLCLAAYHHTARAWAQRSTHTPTHTLHTEHTPHTHK